MGEFLGGQAKPGTWKDSDWSAAARDALRCEKQWHTFVKDTDFNLSVTGTPVTKTVMLYVPYGASQVMGFHALVATPGSAASVTVDLQKNGVSILSSPITLTDATAANAVQDAVISNPTLSGGEILTAVLTVSSSSGMEGVYCWMTVQEQTSPV